MSRRIVSAPCATVRVSKPLPVTRLIKPFDTFRIDLGIQAQTARFTTVATPYGDRHNRLTVHSSSCCNSSRSRSRPGRRCFARAHRFTFACRTFTRTCKNRTLPLVLYDDTKFLPPATSHLGSPTVTSVDRPNTSGWRRLKNVASDVNRH
ncbi:hypothetical protein JAAARDRAFT_423108 [Jaapia argillacea MUCL 33604]|uniref:Uncharacterized protein n=1 Tax=Jaapia argillacea MUCL 33604 TaxID=933084 RepID=A0A067PR50_9AGAM|nr:hypothetical protein JAAARDRAFT_423108 [Jaapia argillacea MUCL 33604]